MVVTSFRTRVAIPAAVGAVAAAAALAVAPTAFADDEAWGAIAVSTDGQSIGVVTDKANQYIADMSANIDCQQGSPAPAETPAETPTEAPSEAQGERVCNVLITFKAPDCGAVVTNGNHYFGDSGPTQQEAEQNAMNQSPGSTLLRAACNGESAEDNGSAATSASSTPTSPPRGRSRPAARRRWA